VPTPNSVLKTTLAMCAKSTINLGAPTDMQMRRL
jgi:hypothetical protein